MSPCLVPRTLALVVATAFAAPLALAVPFTFGIMSDTQWQNHPGGTNSVATGIIDSLNSQFIAAKVDFVVQVGDLTDNGSTAAMQTRANYAQALYDAGIGFMPLRGNHESSAAAATQFQSLYSQTQGFGAHALTGATGFSSPSTMPGLSYAFNYKNTTFVLLDQFTRPNGTAQSVLDQTQVDWVGSVLSAKPASNNAFVFGHKGLITENHTDILFGSNPSAAPTLQNQFISTLQNNGVHYYFGGHDHMDNRAVITSPDGSAKVQDITTSSNSYKFYIPQTGGNINDVKYNNPRRETPISQQLFTIGYYLVTVDGPIVTVDFYASSNGCGTNGAPADCDLKALPSNLSYTRQESYGYSLNGTEFLVASGASFAGLSNNIATGNGFLGTTMKFTAGANLNNVAIYDGRSTVADVTTGWTTRADDGHPELASDVLTLWGLSDLSNTAANTVTLQMSYVGNGAAHLVHKVNGAWVPVTANAGYDALAHTAWADVSLSAIESGNFAVAVPEPQSYAMMLAGLACFGAWALKRRGDLDR